VTPAFSFHLLLEVCDVDYRGSTGYGRAYRRALRKNWGICDVEDACAAAQFLARRAEKKTSCSAMEEGSMAIAPKSFSCFTSPESTPKPASTSLASRGDADATRLAIDGGSAGALPTKRYVPTVFFAR
jgi:hypothetical protein